MVGAGADLSVTLRAATDISLVAMETQELRSALEDENAAGRWRIEAVTSGVFFGATALSAAMLGGFALRSDNELSALVGETNPDPSRYRELRGRVDRLSLGAGILAGAALAAGVAFLVVILRGPKSARGALAGEDRHAIRF